MNNKSPWGCVQHYVTNKVSFDPCSFSAMQRDVICHSWWILDFVVWTLYFYITLRPSQPKIKRCCWNNLPELYSPVCCLINFSRHKVIPSTWLHHHHHYSLTDTWSTLPPAPPFCCLNIVDRSVCESCLNREENKVDTEVCKVLSVVQVPKQ